MVGLNSSPVFAAEMLIRDGQQQQLKRMAPVDGGQRLLRFKKEDGSTIRLGNTFFVVMKNEGSIDQLMQKYSLMFVKQYSDNTFLLATDDDLLKTINKLYQDTATVNVYPNEYRKVIAR